MKATIATLLLLFYCFVGVSYAGLGACCSKNKCLREGVTVDACSGDGVFAGEGSRCGDCSRKFSCCIEGTNSTQMCAVATPNECQSYGGSRAASCASYKSCIYGKYALLQLPTTTASVLTTTTTTTTLPKTGACCVNAECHDNVDVATCESSSGGRFFGFQTKCTDANVKCGGGCCHAQQGCRLVPSKESCNNVAYETYLGDGVGCSLNTCGGACCRGRGSESCEIVSPADCQEKNGDTFLGLGTSSCASCTGACCSLDDMLCQDDVDQVNCRSSANKRFNGAGSRCDDIETCGGACCVKNGEKCMVATGREHCEQELNGFYAGDGEPCTAKVCNGACCKHADAQCTNNFSKSDCGAGRFHGPQSVCEEESCGGACCTSDKTCIITESEEMCKMEANSHWAGFAVGCSAKVCARTPGACCLTDKCVTVDTQERCEAIAGEWQGKNVPCPIDFGVKGSVCYKPPLLQQKMRPHGAAGKASGNAVGNAMTRRQVSEDGLNGACCIPSDGSCSVTNSVDCFQQLGFFRGVNSTCGDDDVCTTCLPCVMGDDETGYCPLRQYNSLDAHSHNVHHSSDESDFKHAHDVHHRHDACESPQLCASNYGRCFVQAVRRGNTADGSFVCGGIDTIDMACAVEYNDGTGRCGVGVCALDAEFGSPRVSTCGAIRHFPCECSCRDQDAFGCGEASGTVTSSGVGVANVTVGLYLSNTQFQNPPIAQPLVHQTTDQNGKYRFQGLSEGTYHVLIIAVPSGYELLNPRPDRLFKIKCDRRRHESSSSSSSSSSDDSEATDSSSSSTSSASDEDFVIRAIHIVAGRVLFDANHNNIDDGEPGIGGALIRARLHPDMNVIQTVMSSALDDGRWQMNDLPTGLYTFEEVDPPNFYSTGDSSGANDNLVTNVNVVDLGNITDIYFFDAPKDLNDDDDDDINDDGGEADDDEDHRGGIHHAHDDCDMIFWFFFSHCYDHVLNKHTLFGVGTILGFLLLFVSLCACSIFCVIAMLRPKKEQEQEPKTEPDKEQFQYSAWDAFTRRNIFEGRRKVHDS